MNRKHRRFKILQLLIEECRIEAKENGHKTFFWMACAIACLALSASIIGRDATELLKEKI